MAQEVGETVAVKAILFDCVGVFVRQTRDEAVIAYAQSLRNQYRVGLTTNLSRQSLSRYFSDTDLSELFDLVISRDMVERGKPWPDMFEMAIEKLGVVPSECLLIDDSPDNCEAARAFGMQVVEYTDVDAVKMRLSRYAK